MKIIMPVNNFGNERDAISGSFHNSPYACIYNVDDNSYKWTETAAITKKPGNLSVELKRKDIRIVLSNYMPPMALNLFVESGFSVFKAENVSIEQNIKLFTSKQLSPLTPLNNVVPKSCDSSSCASCSSSC